MAFENLFKLLRLTDFIHCGTFSKLCEAIKNENEYVRQQVSRIVLCKNNNNATDDLDVSDLLKLLQ